MSFENIVVHLGSCGYRQTRSYAWDTGWRSLPFCLLECVENGSWTVKIKQADAFSFSDGILFIPAGIPHRLIAGGEDRMLSTWCMIDWEAGGVRLRFPPNLFLLRKKNSIRRLLRITRISTTVAPALRRSAALQAEALSLFDSELSRMVRDLRVDDRILKALDRMEASPANVHAIPELAAAVGLSPSRFHELFRAQLKLSPLQYLKTLRLRRALDMLHHTRLSQAKIAELCGFQSLPYFNRCVKAATGQPPGGFRRAAGG